MYYKATLENSPFVETPLTPGCNSDLRAHAEGELFFCLDGKGTVLIADEVIELNRYEAVYVPPNTMHQLRSDRGEHFDVLWTLTPPFGGDKLVCDLAKKAAQITADRKVRLRISVREGTSVKGVPFSFSYRLLL